jgi:hypothetical protein
LKLKSLFIGRVHIGIVSIIFIIGLSYGLLFYLHNITEQEVRRSLFDQQVQSQMESTKSISEHISSDLSLVMNMLDGLANSIYLQKGDLSGEGAKKIMEEKYDQFNTIVNRLFILDKDDVVTIILAPKRSDIFVGADFSFRDWVKETRSNLKPVFSDGFERIGTYRIFITYPIINRTSGEYIGLLGTSIPTVQFFAHYGNVDNINSQFLVAYNKNATLLANGASQDLVGEYFFGSEAQKLINYNEILNNSTRRLLAGKADYAVYDYGEGERLTTGNPILVNDESRYFIQVVTPTEEIYAHVGDVLFIQRIRMFSFLAGTTTAAIAVLILLLTKWNVILRKEVKRRTRELEESYDEMKAYLDTVLAELKRDATIKGKYKK